MLKARVRNFFRSAAGAADARELASMLQKSRAGVPSALQQVAGGGRGGEAQRRWR